MQKSNLKKNAEDAKMISLDLQQKDQIDQKVNYYKSIIKTNADLSEAITKKIEMLEEATDADSIYNKCKLNLELLEIDNTIFEKKKFFEMWLNRSSEYEKKFALITKECEEKFVELEAEARVVAETNAILKSYMTKFDAEENKDQRIKNEYYLLLKYEVGKITKKGQFSTAQ